MQHVIRFTLTLLLTVTLSAAVGAKTDFKEAEYKRADTNYYFKSDVLKADPTAVIIPAGIYTQRGDSYFITPKVKAPHEIYIQVENDWIEPLTPPTMPTSLGVAPDAMQIREIQGDVTVALPTAPANFVPAQNNMAIPNGAVVKTGANGTAAVLMGGVDSIRLIPNSSAAVQQTITPLLRTTEIDLTAGAVFSKVGKRIGEKQDYQVHTPFGVAAARGTDFVTVVMPARVDVWIAQGTVQLTQNDGKMVGTVTSEGTGGLKIIRNPPMPDAHAAMMAGAETITTAMNFIPTVNVYIKALDDKMSQGQKLTPTERDYLNRIKKVPTLIKLALIEPPAPPPAPVPIPPPAPAPVPAAHVPAPSLMPMPAPSAAPAPATSGPTLVPIQIQLADDGGVNLNGVPVTADEQLAGSLDGISKVHPSQPVLIIADDQVSHQLIQKIMGICKAANLTHVKRVKSAPSQSMTPTTTEPAPAVIPAPAAPTPTPAKPAPLVPINVDLRPDAQVDFQGATITLDELKPKLEEIGKATPKQPIVVNGREKVNATQLKKVVALCREAKLTKVTVAKAAPLPPPAPVASAPLPQPAPVAAAPAPVPAATPATPPAPAPVLAPMEVDVRADGKVDFQGDTLSLDDLKPKLEALSKDQPIVIKRKEKLEKGQIKKVTDLCHAANLTKVTVDHTPPPAITASPTTSAPDAPPATVSPPTAPEPKPLPPAMLLPMNIDLRPDGKIDFQGTTYTRDEIKSKLKELGKTTPKQPLVITHDATITHAEAKKFVALCHEAKLTKVTIAKAEPSTAPAVANGAAPATSTATTTAPDASTTIASATTGSTNSAKPKTKSTSHTASAPISTGPEYTVP